MLQIYTLLRVPVLSNFSMSCVYLQGFLSQRKFEKDKIIWYTYCVDNLLKKVNPSRDNGVYHVRDEISMGRSFQRGKPSVRLGHKARRILLSK